MCQVVSQTLEFYLSLLSVKYLSSEVFRTEHNHILKNKRPTLCHLLFYFISLLMCSTCFGHKYIHNQELATILLNYHIVRIVLG